MAPRQKFKRELLHLGVTQADMTEVSGDPSEDNYDAVVKRAIRRLGYYFPTRMGDEDSLESTREIDEGQEKPGDLIHLADHDIAFHQLATTIIGAIMNHLDHTGKVSLLQVQPLIFLGRQLQFYTKDTDDQIFWNMGPRETGSEEVRPLVNWVIQSGIPCNVIRQIVQAYKSDSMDPIDTIWTTLYGSMRPLLHVAIECGRPDVVDLLLEIGADPTLRYSEPGFSGCLYSGSGHQKCARSIYGEAQSPCSNALRCAFKSARAQSMFLFSPEHTRSEDCMLVLLRHGAQVSIFNPRSGEMTKRFNDLLELRFTRVIQAIIDPIFSLPETHQERIQLSLRLDEVLCRAVDRFSPPNKEEALIRHLMELGARTTTVSNGHNPV